MTDEAGPRTEHEGHYGNHEGYACGFSGPHCWACSEPWPCRASRGIEAEAAIPDSRLRAHFDAALAEIYRAHGYGPDLGQSHTGCSLCRIIDRERRWLAALSPEGRQEPPCAVCHQPADHAYHRKHGRTWEPPYHPFYQPDPEGRQEPHPMARGDNEGWDDPYWRDAPEGRQEPER